MTIVQTQVTENAVPVAERLSDKLAELDCQSKQRILGATTSRRRNSRRRGTVTTFSVQGGVILRVLRDETDARGKRSVTVQPQPPDVEEARPLARTPRRMFRHTVVDVSSTNTSTTQQQEIHVVDGDDSKSDDSDPEPLTHEIGRASCR